MCCTNISILEYVKIAYYYFNIIKSTLALQIA